jgi:hypothetical protein
MKGTNLIIDEAVKESEAYINEALEVSADEAVDLDTDNAFSAMINGKIPRGAWRPNRVVRPQNLQVSRTQLRGIGVNHGK